MGTKKYIRKKRMEYVGQYFPTDNSIAKNKINLNNNSKDLIPFDPDNNFFINNEPNNYFWEGANYNIENDKKFGKDSFVGKNFPYESFLVDEKNNTDNQFLSFDANNKNQFNQRKNINPFGFEVDVPYGANYFSKAIGDFSRGITNTAKGVLDFAGTNLENENTLSSEAKKYQISKRYNSFNPTPDNRTYDANSIREKGGRVNTFADSMIVSKNSPDLDFIAEKGEMIVHNGIPSILKKGGSHKSGNDVAIDLDKNENTNSTSYVLSNTNDLKKFKFGGKSMTPSKLAEELIVSSLGKTPDQLVNDYKKFAKTLKKQETFANDNIAKTTNELMLSAKQSNIQKASDISDEVYKNQEILKKNMGIENDIDKGLFEYGGIKIMDKGGANFLGYPKNESKFVQKKYKTEEGVNTPRNVSLNDPYPTVDWEELRNLYEKEAFDSGYLQKGERFKNVADLQQYMYDLALDTEEGQAELNKMWKSFGITNKNESKFSNLQKKIDKGEDLSIDDLKLLRANFIDNESGKRYVLPFERKIPKTNLATETPVTEGKIESDKLLDVEGFKFNPIRRPRKILDISIPAINLPVPYTRDAIGIQLQEAPYVKPNLINIKSQLNQLNRTVRPFRGAQSNTSVDIAREMQSLSNLYNEINNVYGQKYNIDNRSIAQAESSNALMKAKIDADNISRINTFQDLIQRREGLLDTQKRTDFQKSIENEQKAKSYELTKDYIKNTFGDFDIDENLVAFKKGGQVKKKPKTFSKKVK